MIALVPATKSHRSPLKQQLVIHDFTLIPKTRSNGSAGDHDMKHLLSLSPQESEDKRQLADQSELGSKTRYSHLENLKAKTVTTASSMPSLFKQGITNGLAPDNQQLFRFNTR